MNMRKVSWEKDMLARTRVAPRLTDGKLNGRHLIEHDTRISGGIYISATPRLAITVDSNSPEISSIFKNMLERAGKDIPLEEVEENIFLGHVLSITKEAIRTHNSSYIDTVEKFINAPDHEVPLDNFIKLGIGDCRAFALLAGFLTERLTDMLLLLGTANVDRNTVEGHGGHAWVRYKDFFGKVTIIDAPNSYVGTEENGLWVYRRPDEE